MERYDVPFLWAKRQAISEYLPNKSKEIWEYFLLWPYAGDKLEH